MKCIFSPSDVSPHKTGNDHSLGSALGPDWASCAQMKGAANVSTWGGSWFDFMSALRAFSLLDMGMQRTVTRKAD